MRLNWIKYAIGLFCLPYCFAFDNPNNQKILLFADSGSYNFKTGVKEFIGHVRVDQGPTHLLADKLITITNTHHEMVEATAYGIDKTAHYWTDKNMQHKEMHAYANIIHFLPKEFKITLQHQAKIVQGDNTFSADIINYNSNAQTITVPPSRHGRAKIVYKPEG